MTKISKQGEILWYLHKLSVAYRFVHEINN